MNKWTIEKQKQGMEIWANSETEAILIGECYNEKERKRTHYLAAIIVEALNKAEKAEGEAQKAIRLGNEVTDEEA